MFAQVDPNWLQVILQFGALGILAALILVIYPRITRESREEREKRDAVFVQAIASLQARHDERNAALVAAIERQTERLAEQLKNKG